MRVYISADMEGIPGVVNRDQLNPEGFEYQVAREWMTDSVNAVIRGASRAGATEFVVSDSHGNGQNLILPRLTGKTSLVRSWPRPLGMMQGIEDGVFDCAFLVGYHAGVSNIPGGLAHTLNSRVLSKITINGWNASEALISAALADHFAVPVSLLVGDDAFIEETSTFLPEAVGVVSKKSYGLFSALCPKPEDIYGELETSAERAVKTKDKCKFFKLELPLTLELWLKSRLAAEYASALPFVKRTGAFSFSFEARDITECVGMLNFFLNYKPDLA
jgi:D-amino peptidase